MSKKQALFAAMVVTGISLSLLLGSCANGVVADDAKTPFAMLMLLSNICWFASGVGFHGFFSEERRLADERFARRFAEVATHRRTGTVYFAWTVGPDGQERLTGGGGRPVLRSKLRPDVVEAFERGRLTSDQIAYLMSETSVPKEELN